MFLAIYILCYIEKNSVLYAGQFLFKTLEIFNLDDFYKFYSINCLQDLQATSFN